MTHHTISVNGTQQATLLFPNGEICHALCKLFCLNSVEKMDIFHSNIYFLLLLCTLSTQHFTQNIMRVIEDEKIIQLLF